MQTEETKAMMERNLKVLEGIQTNETIERAEQKMFELMSDKELLYFTGVVYNDYILASESQPTSDWYLTCFGTLIICSQEMGVRGLKLDVR